MCRQPRQDAQLARCQAAHTHGGTQILGGDWRARFGAGRRGQPCAILHVDHEAIADTEDMGMRVGRQTKGEFAVAALYAEHAVTGLRRLRHLPDSAQLQVERGTGLLAGKMARGRQRDYHAIIGLMDAEARHDRRTALRMRGMNADQKSKTPRLQNGEAGNARTG